MQKAHLKKKKKEKRKKRGVELQSISLEPVRKRFHWNMFVAPLAVHGNHSFLEEVEMSCGQKYRPLKKAALKTDTHSKQNYQPGEKLCKHRNFL